MYKVNPLGVYMYLYICIYLYMGIYIYGINVVRLPISGRVLNIIINRAM